LIGTSVTFSAGYLSSWLHRERMNA
jgi:hypothetical protein